MNPQEYYNNKFIIYELVKQLQNKYMSIMDVNTPDKKKKLTRYVLAYNYELFLKQIQFYEIMTKPTKLYFDLLTIKETKMFPYTGEKRTEMKQWYDDNIKNNAMTYDIAIDIDNKNWKKSHADAKKIKKEFDTFKLPYSIKWSGQKGFHFLIQGKYNPLKPTVQNAQKIALRIDKMIKKHKLTSVDTAIYDIRRILKLAYSLDGNNICLPLNDEQFMYFKPEMCSADTILKNQTIKIFNRGLLTRTWQQNHEQLTKNVKKWIK